MKKTSLWGFILLCLTSICFTACGGDDEGSSSPSLDKTSLSLYVDETSILKYSEGNCSWLSDNSLIAEVKDGVVTAKHVGTTTIHANNLTCTVTVKPKYTSYVEPYMGWGSNKSVVKSYMSGYTINKEETNSIAYVGKGRVQTYVYLFENGLMKSSAMQISLLNLYDITDFLLERYVVLDTEKKSDTDYYVYMLSVDKKMLIVLNVSTSYCLVLYGPATSSSNARQNEVMKAQMKKIMIN